MQILIGEWNEKNDASRKWGAREEGLAPLDDTSLAADVIANYLTELGHEVYPAEQRPPQSTKDWGLDLFIGVGAGNPLQIWGSKKQADSDLLGIETKFPIVWLGAQNASANPFGVRYRTLARWPSSDIEDISPIQSINRFIPFEERKKRDRAIKDSIDSIFIWLSRCINNPSSILNFKENKPKGMDYIKDELEVLKANQKLMLSSINSIETNLINFTEIHRESIFKLQSEVEMNFDKLFESDEEKKTILNHLNQIAKSINKEEWYNEPLKSKIKIMLPLVIFKYEKELNVTDFKFPQNWKELKQIFITNNETDLNS